MTSVMCMQGDNNIEHTNGKCHDVMSILMINSLTIVWPTHKPHNIIEHTNPKILYHTNAKYHEITLMVKLLAISIA